MFQIAYFSKLRVHSPMNPWLTRALKKIKYNHHYFKFQCILMQVILVILWISNLVTLPWELLLQPHVHGASKSTNTPVISKIWLRKNSNINLWFFFSFLNLKLILISELDVLSTISAAVVPTTSKHLTTNQDLENIWLIKDKLFVWGNDNHILYVYRVIGLKLVHFRLTIFCG